MSCTAKDAPMIDEHTLQIAGAHWEAHNIFFNLLQCTDVAQRLACSVVHSSKFSAHVADLHLLQSKAIANAHARSIAKR